MNTSPKKQQKFTESPTRSYRSLQNPEKPPAKKSLDRSEASVSPFKPHINKHSQNLTKKNKAQNCWNTLYEDSITKKNKIERVRKQEFENEFKNSNLTFHPLIISRAKSSTDLVTRTYSWLKEKNQKISLKIKAEASKDLEQCTFTPEIHEFKDEGSEILKNIKGVQRFLLKPRVAKSEKVAQRTQSRSRDLSIRQYKGFVEDLSSYLHSFDINYTNFDS